jgi:hypothetical protein
MKYQCDDCKRVFNHPAKLLEHRAQELLVTPNKITPAVHLDDFVETEYSACPFCKNLAFTEYVEPVEELEDVISVEYVNVGQKIAEGYRVKEIYAKSVTLVKPKVKSP